MVVALRRTTLSCNGIEGCSGLHSSPCSDISESVFCIASGQYAKSQYDWQQETPTQRSAALSTAQSLHTGTLPRLDTSEFPSYVTTSGWIFHTIQAPLKKDKDGNPTLGTRGGILLATRKNTFAISEKIHHHTDLYQTATWTLSAGEFLPTIHITGVYLSPDNKVPS